MKIYRRDSITGKKKRIYRKGSAAYSRAMETRMYQRIAAARPKPERRTDGQKYLHPERHRKTARV